MERASKQAFDEFLGAVSSIVTENKDDLIGMFQRRYSRTNPHFLWSPDFVETVDKFKKRVLSDSAKRYQHLAAFNKLLKTYETKPLKHLLQKSGSNGRTDTVEDISCESWLNKLAAGGASGRVHSPPHKRQKKSDPKHPPASDSGAHVPTRSKSPRVDAPVANGGISKQLVLPDRRSSSGQPIQTVSNKHSSAAFYQSNTNSVNFKSPTNNGSCSSSNVVTISDGRCLGPITDLAVVEDVEVICLDDDDDEDSVVNQSATVTSSTQAASKQAVDQSKMNPCVSLARTVGTVVLSVDKNKTLADQQIVAHKQSSLTNNTLSASALTATAANVVAVGTSSVARLPSPVIVVPSLPICITIDDGPDCLVVGDEPSSRLMSEQPGTTDSPQAGSLSGVGTVGSKSAKLVQRLELLLKNLSDRIKKLRESELTLDDLDSATSSYAEEDRYTRKFVKVWKKLCEVKGRPVMTGRPTERKIEFEVPRYPEVGKKVAEFVNTHANFPDFQDIFEIISCCNTDCHYGISKKTMESLARDIFTDIGNKLQQRRLDDYIQNFGCHLTDGFRSSHDPALADKKLNEQLDKNLTTASSKLNELINFYAYKQDEVGDKTDDESDDNEEEADRDSVSVATQETVAGDDDVTLEKYGIQWSVNISSSGSDDEDEPAADAAGGTVHKTKTMSMKTDGVSDDTVLIIDDDETESQSTLSEAAVTGQRDGSSTSEHLCPNVTKTAASCRNSSALLGITRENLIIPDKYKDRTRLLMSHRLNNVTSPSLPLNEWLNGTRSTVMPSLSADGTGRTDCDVVNVIDLESD